MTSPPMLTSSTTGASTSDSVLTSGAGAGAGALEAAGFAGVAMSVLGGYAVHYSTPTNQAMSLTPEQIAELQAKAAEAEQLKQRLAAVDGNKGEILEEKKKLLAELQQLKDQEEARKKKELEEQGKTAELLDQERKEKEALLKEKERLEQEKLELAQERINDRLKSDFVSALAGEAFVPAQLWTLFASAVKDSNGKTVVNYKGAEVAPSELAAKLRNDPEYAYHFKPKQGAGGMGSRPSAGGTVDLSGNPYLPGGSVTQRIQLELEDPDMAAKLRAEAGSARAKG